MRNISFCPHFLRTIGIIWEMGGEVKTGWVCGKIGAMGEELGVEDTVNKERRESGLLTNYELGQQLTKQAIESLRSSGLLRDGNIDIGSLDYFQGCFTVVIAIEPEVFADPENPYSKKASRILGEHKEASDVGKLLELSRAVLDEVPDIDGLYIYGSVPRGYGLKETSDVDLVALVNDEGKIPKTDRERVEVGNRIETVVKDAGYVGGIDFVGDRDDFMVLDSEGLLRYIKGEDLRRSLLVPDKRDVLVMRDPDDEKKVRENIDDLVGSDEYRLSLDEARRNIIEGIGKLSRM